MKIYFIGPVGNFQVEENVFFMMLAEKSKGCLVFDLSFQDEMFNLLLLALKLSEHVSK